MLQSVQVKIDESGRIVIPAPLQSQLGLSPGMTLVVESEDEGGVTLRLQPGQPEIVDKDGILVVRAEGAADLKDAVRADRERRLAALLDWKGS